MEMEKKTIKRTNGGLLWRPEIDQKIQFEGYHDTTMRVVWQDPAYHGKEANIYIEASQYEQKGDRFYYKDVLVHLTKEQIAELKEACERILKLAK